MPDWEGLALRSQTWLPSGKTSALKPLPVQKLPRGTANGRILAARHLALVGGGPQISHGAKKGREILTLVENPCVFYSLGKSRNKNTFPPFPLIWSMVLASMHWTYHTTSCGINTQAPKTDRFHKKSEKQKIGENAPSHGVHQALWNWLKSYQKLVAGG